MVALAERLGERLLTLFVPDMEARAEGIGTAACVYRFCHCVGCGSRLRRCCNGVCTGCNYVGDCPRCA